MAWNWTDSPGSRRIQQQLAASKGDLDRVEQDAALLKEFRERFPADRLATLSVRDYALGTGNDNSFCLWLERKLAPLGRYGLGSARAHFLYQRQDGSFYVLKRLSDLAMDDAMHIIAKWHARVVELGGSSNPEILDERRYITDDPEHRQIRTDRVTSRVLKLLASYYPDRFVPVMSTAHLAHLLKMLGVPEELIPAGAVGRSLLLTDAYEALGKPQGVSPAAFMRILYEVFDPKQSLVSHRARLHGAARLFRWLYGDDAFESDSYRQSERYYKEALADRWQNAVTPETLEASLADDAATTAMATRIADILTSTEANFFPWRYHAVLTGAARSPHQARILVQASAGLLGIEEEGIPDISAFNRAMAPLYTEHLNEGAKTATSRSLPSVMLWLSYPASEFYVRSDVYHRIRKALTGKSRPESGELMSTEEYIQARELASAIWNGLSDAGLSPQDMIDVQGFCWGIFNHSRIWFGGTKYDNKHQMLPRFLQNGVFASGFASDPEVIEIMTNAATWQGQERTEKRHQLESTLTTAAPRKALLNLFDLAGASDSIIIAKATTYSQTRKESIAHINAVGQTKGVSGFQKGLGHTVGVDWMAEPKLVLRVGRLWSQITSTLTALPLEKALDLLAKPEVGDADGISSDDEIESEAEGEQAVAPTVLKDRPALPRNLILYGPPGTGKTYRLWREILPEFEDRWRMITFHPGYSYEEFIEGLRPVTAENGSISYSVEPGIFRRLCEQAAHDRTRPYALLIDEINRGNVAALFGELITLIEADKRGEITVTLPYSKEPFTVPPNLYIIGTMNTADRSIALMDVALRRRFEFEEVQVDMEVLRSHLEENQLPDGIVDEVDVVRMLEIMNKRLRYLYDRDHQIGHAWLMDVRSLADLRHTFAKRIIPLLIEYFYEDWAKVAIVLGEHPEIAHATDFLTKMRLNEDEEQTLFPHKGSMGRGISYELSSQDSWTRDHFRKIASPEPIQDASADGQ